MSNNAKPVSSVITVLEATTYEPNRRDCDHTVDDTLFPVFEYIPGFHCSKPAKPTLKRSLLSVLATAPVVGTYFQGVLDQDIYNEHLTKCPFNTVESVDRFVREDIAVSLVNPNDAKA